MLRAATDCRPIVAPKSKAGVAPDTMERAIGLSGPLFLRDLLTVARGRVSRMPFARLVDVYADEGERPSGRSVPGQGYGRSATRRRRTTWDGVPTRTR